LTRFCAIDEIEKIEKIEKVEKVDKVSSEGIASKVLMQRLRKSAAFPQIERQAARYAEARPGFREHPEQGKTVSESEVGKPTYLVHFKTTPLLTGGV